MGLLFGVIVAIGLCVPLSTKISFFFKIYLYCKVFERVKNYGWFYFLNLVSHFNFARFSFEGVEIYKSKIGKHTDHQ